MNKKGVAVFALFLVLGSSLYGQDVQAYFTKAKEAYAHKDYPNYYANLVEANKLHPYHQVILYQLGIAAALTQHPDLALQSLKKAIYIDTNFDLKKEELNAIRASNEFAILLQLQKELQIPIINSDTAFVLPNRTAHIESVAYDKASQSFYLGSIHQRKIIKRNRAGVFTDFTAAGEHGITSVFGLQVDSKNNLLWACASPMPEMENYDSTAPSAVYKFNLSTGHLLGSYKASNVPESVFGDLTLTSKGEVFVSDSKSNIIFKVDEASKSLQPFFQSEEFWNIQGLTFSTDDRYLFISDYIRGPYRLDVRTKELHKLTASFDQSLKGIDGLTYYKNSLIAIQNGVHPFRVSVYTLNKEQSTLTSCQIIDRAHPAFNEPTIGFLNGNDFYYVANSQWEGYDETHTIKPENELQDVLILKANLSSIHP